MAGREPTRDGLAGSIVSYPERGPWGSAGYRGNCTGHLVRDLILRFGARSVFDPAEGSGTVRDVVKSLNRQGDRLIRYEGRDLKHGWDVCSSKLPDRFFDLIFFHPPYWDIIGYTQDWRDLSMSVSVESFESRLTLACRRLASVVKEGGVLAVLIGDKRRGGEYFPLLRPLLKDMDGLKVRGVLIKEQHNARSDTVEYSTRNPFFVPIRHEYCVLLEKVKVNTKSLSKNEGLECMRCKNERE